MKTRKGGKNNQYKIHVFKCPHPLYSNKIDFIVCFSSILHINCDIAYISVTSTRTPNFLNKDISLLYGNSFKLSEDFRKINRYKYQNYSSTT